MGQYCLVSTKRTKELIKVALQLKGITEKYDKTSRLSIHDLVLVSQLITGVLSLVDFTIVKEAEEEEQDAS